MQPHWSILPPGTGSASWRSPARTGYAVTSWRPTIRSRRSSSSAATDLVAEVELLSDEVLRHEQVSPDLVTASSL